MATIPGLSDGGAIQVSPHPDFFIISRYPHTAAANNYFISASNFLPISMANGGAGVSLTAANGGIVYSSASQLNILTPTVTANQVLLSGASTTPAWSTATYPATTTINQLLYSSSPNVIAGLATVAAGVVATDAIGAPKVLSMASNGSLLIGSSVLAAAVGNITASGNISVTNGSNTIALSVTGTASLSFSAITSSGALVVNKGVIVTSGALSLSLPTTAAVGDVFYVILSGGTSWTITQAASQQIRLGSTSTTSGVGGSLASSAQGDAIYFVCDVANLHFVAATGTQGNITVV